MSKVTLQDLEVVGVLLLAAGSAYVLYKVVKEVKDSIDAGKKKAGDIAHAIGAGIKDAADVAVDIVKNPLTSKPAQATGDALSNPVSQAVGGAFRSDAEKQVDNMYARAQPKDGAPNLLQRFDAFVGSILHPSNPTGLKTATTYQNDPAYIGPPADLPVGVSGDYIGPPSDLPVGGGAYSRDTIINSGSTIH